MSVISIRNRYHLTFIQKADIEESVSLTDAASKTQGSQTHLKCKQESLTLKNVNTKKVNKSKNH